MSFDARAGRVFRLDYDLVSRTNERVDITSPAPRFAVDFGGLQIGYVNFTPMGPDWRIAPEGQPLPEQPVDKDKDGKLLFKPCFRVFVYGKVLNGLREFSSTAGCVLESLDDLYAKFRDAPEARAGKVPIVELTKSIPIAVGRGERGSTVYSPCWAIVGWTERVKEFGPRTVTAPLVKKTNGGAAPPPANVIQMGPDPRDTGTLPTRSKTTKSRSDRAPG